MALAIVVVVVVVSKRANDSKRHKRFDAVKWFLNPLLLSRFIGDGLGNRLGMVIAESYLSFRG